MKIDGTGYKVWSTLTMAVLSAKKLSYVLTVAMLEADPDKTKYVEGNEHAYNN